MDDEMKTPEEGVEETVPAVETEETPEEEETTEAAPEVAEEEAEG